ncbi:MAG TPA: nucleotidyltransferase family protein [Planctomycetota bacterium]|nr:nucleotidyltransferase family protein [Planctomycetota bacterium]
MRSVDGWVGALSVVGRRAAPPPPLVPRILDRSRRERTLAVVSRNLGLPCEEERAILGRQLLARHQWDEIRGRLEAIPLKGLHLAHRLYPSPGLRDMGDIDLLARDVSAADRALRGLGYAPERDARRASPLDAVEYLRDDGLPVHLHGHVSNASLPHFMYRVDVGEIWAASRGGEMAPHHQVVTLCEHALKHSFSELILLTDIELAGRDADPGLVAETASRWGLERAVHYARVLLRDLMEAETAALERVPVPPPGWEGRAFLGWARRRRWNGLSALGFLSMARGFRAKARFVREALAPRSTEGLRTRTVAGRVGRALEALATWRRRGPR